jgi:hypothetical protein
MAMREAVARFAARRQNDRRGNGLKSNAMTESMQYSLVIAGNSGVCQFILRDDGVLLQLSHAGP